MTRHSARSGGSRVLRLVAIGLGGLVLLVAAGAAVFVATFDANAYKPQIAAAVKQATGRDLALKGSIGLRLSLQPALEVHDVTFANPPGFSRPEMATLQRLDVQVALLPLLSRRVEVERLVLVRPDIRLELDPQGKPNWRMTPPATPVPAAVPQAGGSVATAPAQIAIHDIRVEHGTIEYRDGKTGRGTMLGIRQLVASGSLDEGLKVKAEAAYNGAPLTLAATVGSPLGGKPMPLDVSVGAAGATLTVKGAVADPAAMSGVNLAVVAEVPDLKALSPLAGSELPPFKPLAFQATLTDLGGLAKGAKLGGLKLTLPGGDLAGEIAVALAAMPTVTADLKSERIDADALRAALGMPAAPAPASAPTPAPAPAPAVASGRMIPDQPLPLEALRLANADVNVAIAVWRTNGVDYKAIKAHAVLKDGRLRLDPLAADLPQGHLDATLTLDAAAAPPQVALTARAPGLALAPLLAMLNKPGYATGNLEILADLRGTGASPHAIAASLNGSLGLAVERGTMDGRMLAGPIGSALEKINGLTPWSRAGAGELRCFALRMDLRGGVGTLRALQLSSALLTMDGTGSVNLGNETLDLRLRPVGQVAGTGVVVPVIVTGSLRAPSATIDPVGTAIGNVGSIAGSVAGKTTPLGIIGSVVGNAAGVNILGGGDPCPPALALARGRDAPAAAGGSAGPSRTPPKTQQPTQPGNLLRNLFR